MNPDDADPAPLPAAGDAVRAAVERRRRLPLTAEAREAGFEALVDELIDLSGFALALARGDLERPLPHSGSMAGSLKALQAALRHLTWQTQRVAAGDFSQRVDFMGDFSTAFNSMVVALEEARTTLDLRNHELQELAGRLEELATTDALTGTWNRRKFNELVGAEVARAHRYGGPLSLFILDIDQFKRVNDTYGHEAGDSVLRDIAEIVRGAIRGADDLARWGGEEFVVLSPGVDAEGSGRLAGRVRGVIAGHDFAVAGRLTASFGVAGYEAGDTPDALFARADAALYRAKEAGRDRVVIAS